MKIISEKTGKTYGSVEECVKDEDLFDKKVAAEKAAKEKALMEQKTKKEALAAERKEAATVVEEKRKAMIEANKAFKDELSNFCKKFGAYHYSIQPSTNSEMLEDTINSVFDDFWFWF